VNYTADVRRSFLAMNRRVSAGRAWPAAALVQPLTVFFFHPLLERHATSLRLDQIFQSRGDSCLEGSSGRQAGRQDESVYNFVTSDKELPFIICVGVKVNRK
jgi:hypothetical protein